LNRKEGKRRRREWRGRGEKERVGRERKKRKT
jgi:hypothetical protein